jgi:hypothetical protein
VGNIGDIINNESNFKSINVPMNGNVETRHLGAKGPFIGGRRWL